MSDISTKEAPSIVTPAEAPPQYSAYNATTNSGQCDLPIVIPRKSYSFQVNPLQPTNSQSQRTYFTSRLFHLSRDATRLPSPISRIPSQSLSSSHSSTDLIMSSSRSRHFKPHILPAVLSLALKCYPHKPLEAFYKWCLFWPRQAHPSSAFANL